MQLPIVDRSRFKEGAGRCEHKRYLEYDYLGTGLRPKGESVPLITGTTVHKAIAGILLNHNDPSSFDKIIAEASEEYRKSIEESGFLELEADATEQIEHLVTEQMWLSECLSWGFVRQVLPWLLSEFDIVRVEQEETLVLGCSCGVPQEPEPKLHEARGCNGVVLMSKPDLILKRKSTGEILSWDAKTTSDPGYAWRQSFEDNLQLALQLIASENSLDCKIVGSYILGIVKGRRDKNRDEPEEPPYQQSPFCYIYFKDDPFEGEIRYTYNYVDEAGANRKATKGKGFNRKAVWQLEGKWSQTPKLWVDSMPEEILKQSFVELGPFPRPKQAVIDGMIAGLYGNEMRWNQRKAELAKAGAEFAEYFFPKSWECRRYNNTCPYLAICNNDQLEPIESGRFVRRVPHHLLEAERAKV